MSYLQHVTLTTGHQRRSSLSEITAQTRSLLAPVLRAALEERALLPGVGDYWLTGTAEGRNTSTWTVWAGSDVLATIGVARRSRGGAALWRRLCGATVVRVDAGAEVDPEAPPPAPWCGAVVEPAAVQYPAAIDILGDLERCIAWTWLEDVA